MKLTFIDDIGGLWAGEAKLWEASEYFVCPRTQREAKHVVSCALDQDGRKRTYLFAVESNGQDVIDWNELYGSYSGDLDHDRAVREFEIKYTKETA